LRSPGLRRLGFAPFGRCAVWVPRLWALRPSGVAPFEMRRAADSIPTNIVEPVVQVHGPIATVWAPYDIHRNRQFVHCGVDAFTPIRTTAGWKIATVVYTAEPTGCAPSPLGPLR